MSQFPIIKTERFVLRQFKKTDLENVYNGLSNPEVIKYYGVSFNSLAATKEQIDWYAHLENSQTGIWWAICSSENSNFYGACGFNNLVKQYRKAEIGFWLLPNFWKKGIMNEAIELVCNYAFKSLKLHHIEAFVETENFNCKKTLDKSGFSYERTMNNCEIKNDNFISLDVYVKLSSNQ